MFAFSIVSAHAQQTVKQYQAKIPFDFSVGQKSYQAGDYVIKISRLSSNGLLLSLEDDNNHKLQSVIVSETDTSSKDEPKLLFYVQENQRYLSKIFTPEIGLSLGKPKTEKIVTVKNQQPASKPQTIAVIAHR
jgi:hypothetical protein